MAVDWGTVLSGAVDIWQGQPVGGGGSSFGPGAYAGMASPAPVPVGTGDPNYNGAAWAKGQRCKRRRSRPMLTPTNMALMHQIGTLPNNANVRIALAKAIRKS